MTLDFAGPRWGVLGPHVPLRVEELDQSLGQPLDGNLLFPPDVEHLADRLRGFGRQPDCLDRVAHLVERPSLPTVSKKDRRLPIHDPQDESRDHFAVESLKMLSGSISVEQAQHHAGQPVGSAIDAKIQLSGELGGAVGGAGLQRMRLVHGNVPPVAVHFGGGGVDNFAYLIFKRGHADVQGTSGVDFVDQAGIVKGDPHALNREVIDEIHSARGAKNGFRVSNVALDEPNPTQFEMVPKVLPPSGRKVVQHPNLVAGPGEIVDQIAADKARAAGDQNFFWNHFFPLD